MAENIHNPQLQLAHDFIQYTGEHLFLTGKAGTGKTTFLHRLKEKSPKRMIVVAPTGVAAINAGGVTIHSFFQIPFGPWVPGGSAREQSQAMRFSREKRNIIKSLDLLVIDEISMVRADLLDSVDEVLRRFRRSSAPFGGVQLLMIGDMQQLPPVVKDDEWDILRKYYKTAFFFSSLALQKTKYRTITLQHVYRQQDQAFIDLLNKIRDKQAGREVIEALGKRFIPGFPDENENYIILTTHNAKAKNINESRLRSLREKSYRFKAEIEDNFPEFNFPTDPLLELKVGAQVMFIKNDPGPEKNYYNGKIGTVEDFTDDGVLVKCPDEDHLILAPKIEWQNIKYAIDDETQEIRESIEGTFRQIPLKLAWAITIHKSQGLTFDRVIIDAEAAFAHGQVYVALSRCRSLEGLVLSTPFNPGSLKNNQSIEVFNRFVEDIRADEKELEVSKRRFQRDLLEDLFRFDQLKSYLYRFQKIIRESQGSLPPGSLTMTGSILDGFLNDISAVAEQFGKQYSRLLNLDDDAERNPVLQERVTKAAGYFSGKIDELILGKIEAMDLETDSRNVKKAVSAAEENVLVEAHYKKACLLACKEGFSVKAYLKAKAEASMEGTSVKRTRKKSKPEVSDTILNPALYEKLKQWRDDKAAELDLPHYMVMQLKTLRALSNQVPATLIDLKQVHGFGKRKITLYGAELLEILVGYRDNDNVTITPPPIPSKPLKPAKKDTKKASLDLWRIHGNIPDVARERGLAQSTVEGHLAYFVGTGELDVTEFVDRDKLHLISDFFNGQGDMPLSAAKDHLGDDVSFSELRFVREHLILKNRRTD